MCRCVKLVPYLPSDELDRRYRQSRDPVERMHWYLVWLIAPPTSRDADPEGMSCCGHHRQRSNGRTPCLRFAHSIVA